jgi:hypothetical protein
MLRRELQGTRMESAHLRGELSSSGPHSTQQGPPPPGQPGSQQGPYPPEPYNASRPELPPLRSISNGMPSAPDSMTGVQYEAPRVNGYRPEQRY